MRIFLSYAGEYRDIADSIALRLRQAGNDVFFDKDDLPPAQSFDDRIREGLEGSDLLVFLVSPESVAAGAYTLTEMELARERWRNPNGRVLPVMVKPTPYDAIPEYLKAVTVLEPKGNVVAETANAVARLSRSWRRQALTLAAALAAIGVVGLVIWRLLAPGPGEPWSAGGKVTDLTTDEGVPGATVEVRCGVTPLAQVTTDSSGGFAVSFAACRAGATLGVKHERYIEQTVGVDRSGSELAIALLGKGLGECVLRNGQGVVVGRFRLPIASSGSTNDLAGRVAETLTFDVLTVVQTLNLPVRLQPRFVACDEAQPRSPGDAPGYARALGADAFVSGDVEAANGAFNVRAFVGDPFRLIDPLLSTKTTNVALDDPAAADLDAETQVSILTAVARGYSERQEFAACVDVANAAMGLLGRATEALRQTLARCQAGTGISDLGRGAEP